MTSNVTVKCRRLNPNEILFSMKISNLSVEMLQNEGKFKKLLVNKKDKTKQANLLAKILIPKEAFNKTNSNKSFKNNNVKLSIVKDLYQLTYENILSSGALVGDTLRIIDVNFGAEYTVTDSSVLTTTYVNQTPKKKKKKKSLNEQTSTSKSQLKETRKKIEKRRDQELSARLPKERSQVKIWEVRDTAFKRCGNCINLGFNNICRKHDRKVTVDNACNLFYTPRVYLGGAMSPR